MTEPPWTVRGAPPIDRVEEWVRALKVPPLVASSLSSRADTTLDDVAAASTVLEPIALPEVEEAVDVLVRAVRLGKRILVHGDYDADGMTGTAVLALGLRDLGARVETFVPNRLTHGYGVATELVDRHASKAEVFVTVDCGVNDVDQVARLRSSGVDVIVTDHHTPGPVWPDAVIVHPRRANPAPVAKVEPTGAGVAFHLLWHVHLRLGLQDPLEYTDLAALGTIADVAPLLGANRALVREGLSRIASSRWPGVQALARVARVGRPVSARDVAFGMAPRLNAAGRLGVPEEGLELLVTSDASRASHLAAALDVRNDERKRIQEAMVAEAIEMVDDAPAVVVANDAWHPGVMGIVASKLLERFQKPVFIAAKGQGSVRSTPGVSAVEALTAARAHLDRFGGHRAAAGFRLSDGQLEPFRASIHAFVETQPSWRPRVVVDAVIEPWMVDEDLWRGIGSLEPFGEGLAPPTFALTGSPTRLRSVGRNGDHLQIHVGDVKGVVFGEGAFAGPRRGDAPVQVAGQLVDNAWNGRRTVEFQGSHVRVATPLRSDTVRRSDTSATDLRFVRTTTAPDDGLGRWTIVKGLAPPRGPSPGGDADAPDGAWAEAVASGRRVAFDLSPDDLTTLSTAARTWPTVHEIRRTFVALGRGGRALLCDVAHGRALAALDAMGLTREGQVAFTSDRVDPYACDLVVTGLMIRHRLHAFVAAYRHLDDVPFDETVAALYGRTET